jgi:hypothetical protein
MSAEELLATLIAVVLVSWAASVLWAVVMLLFSKGPRR